MNKNLLEKIKLLSGDICEKTGYEFDNLSFVNRWKNNTPTNSTIITVWGGTNDYFGVGNDVFHSFFDAGQTLIINIGKSDHVRK